MSTPEQKLVNAQVEINRAVFLMNYQDDRDFAVERPPVTPQEILDRIDGALQELKAARRGYARIVRRKPRPLAPTGPRCEECTAQAVVMITDMYQEQQGGRVVTRKLGKPHPFCATHARLPEKTGPAAPR